METARFRKILCANRGEIAIRVFRACSELGIKTVAIFSEEDRNQQHRYKADEAYLVGKNRSPIEAYLGVEEILEVAARANVSAIHPGYGFLSENAEFAAACAAHGITFIGPPPNAMRTLGDKVLARELAQRAGVRTVPGLNVDIANAEGHEAARQFFREHAPVIIKAAHGGGGRGMRMVRSEADLDEAIAAASREAKAAFGSGFVFLEKLLERVRHIEVQVLGDIAGNLVHVHERDCSVQRRHQKVIEIAPAPNLPDHVRRRLHDDALKLARAANYVNAGTVEFLVAGDVHYFIEVNPRLQVEHTVTEEVTGIDLVQAQIRIAEGHLLASEDIRIWSQSDVRPQGFAIQCRVTTEDPGNHFMPDTGTILAYRAAAGFGIRLDSSNGYAGAVVSPHYDSLLVKVTARARTFREAAAKNLRALTEFRIRGVKTNLQFLENVLQHDTFLNGSTYTRFIDDTPELFELTPRRDRATKLLLYLAEVIVNGHPTIKAPARLAPSKLLPPPVPTVDEAPAPDGTAQVLAEQGPEGLARWVLGQDRPLLTDTTMRDAHQSLLATRVRTYDILKIAGATARLAPQLFSLETWGGATFDVAYRFLNEDPWERLRLLKQAVPNVLQQMLLRGANAVGYTSYPDNVVEAFIDEAATAGIDVFRVFDSLNDLDNMRFAVERVRKTGKVAEVAICYTGDVANPARKKYDLEYYVDLARRIEDMGAHFLCIKDMAGLIRPKAAKQLIGRLREVTRLPIHLHTHDTSGNGVATLIEAIRAGVHIVDVALAPMAGLTSQPSMNALVAALHGTTNDTGMRNKPLQSLCDYWESVREYYAPFECGLKSSTSEIYFHEIPGGQYSNLRPQVAELGLLSRWNDVKLAFAVVNQVVGDIPKVTPSSKMVGDFATFLVQNGLLEVGDTLEDSTTKTRARVLAEAARLDFPQSVVTYFQGSLGRPKGGFPKDLQDAVLRGLPVVEGRPGEAMEPLDLDKLQADLGTKWNRKLSRRDALSAALYPRVMNDYFDFFRRHANVSILDTPHYFYGMEPEEEIWVELEAGKTLVIRLQAVSDAFEDGTRTVYFELNGQGRHVSVVDRSLADPEATARRADRADPNHIGASMPGKVIAVNCVAGQEVNEGAPLLTLEAMKMETVVRAPRAAKVAEVVCKLRDAVQADDLLIVLK
ncbi:MAG: pyruvate carboxylase [Planctomycetota bacterium]